MNPEIDTYASKVVMRREYAAALIAKVQRLEKQVAILQGRVGTRENQLVLALHELALLRGEKDTKHFIFRRLKLEKVQ